ncbi:MAG: SH3 domain-containing protein [Succinivibrio sp.]|nr:SH3 domain-containing protein [Succinivibrio sp.]
MVGREQFSIRRFSVAAIVAASIFLSSCSMLKEASDSVVDTVKSVIDSIAAFLVDLRPVPQPELTGLFADADHFVSSDSMNVPLLMGNQLKEVNSSMLRRGLLSADLRRYPKKVSGEFVQNSIRNQIQQAQQLAQAGAVRDIGPLTKTRVSQYVDECGIDTLGEVIDPKYVVITTRTAMNLLPAKDVWFPSNDVKYGNVFKVDTAAPGEPAVILATSASGRFCYVQTALSRGWISSFDYAPIGRIQWLKAVDPEDLAVVTDIRLKIKVNKKPYEYAMGDIILLDKAKSTVDELYGMFPRYENGRLEYVSERLPSSAVNLGYLPASRANIVHQAYLFKGMSRSKNGDLEELYSNSLMFARAYRTAGIKLSSDVQEQKRMISSKLQLMGYRSNEKLSIYHEVKPGDLLYFEGDVAMYLGITPDTGRAAKAISAYLYIGQFVNYVETRRDVHDHDKVDATDLSYLVTYGGTAYRNVEFAASCLQELKMPNIRREPAVQKNSVSDNDSSGGMNSSEGRSFIPKELK